MSLTEWLHRLQETTGLNTHQMQWVAAAVAIVMGLIGFAIYLGKAWGWNSGRREFRREQRAFKRGEDRGKHVMIERLIFSRRADGFIGFDRETFEGAHDLDTVIQDEELCALIREAIRHERKDHRIFAPGRYHRLMMERIEAYITGNDQAASQAAMFDRHEEYHADLTHFTARFILGADGFKMLHVLLFNREYLDEMANDPNAFIRKLKPRRQKYGLRYTPLFSSLSRDFTESIRLFAENEDEERAGESAMFWEALIRTQRPGISLSDVQQMIAAAVRSALSRAA